MNSVFLLRESSVMFGAASLVVSIILDFYFHHPSRLTLLESYYIKIKLCLLKQQYWHIGISRRNPSELEKSHSETILVTAIPGNCFTNSEILVESY